MHDPINSDDTATIVWDIVPVRGGQGHPAAEVEQTGAVVGLLLIGLLAFGAGLLLGLLVAGGGG